MLRTNPERLSEPDSDLAKGLRRMQRNADTLMEKMGLEGVTPEDLKRASEGELGDKSLIEKVREDLPSEEMKEAA